MEDHLGGVKGGGWGEEEGFRDWMKEKKEQQDDMLYSAIHLRQINILIKNREPEIGLNSKSREARARDLRCS